MKILLCYLWNFYHQLETNNQIVTSQFAEWNFDGNWQFNLIFICVRYVRLIKNTHVLFESNRFNYEEIKYVWRQYCSFDIQHDLEVSLCYRWASSRRHALKDHQTAINTQPNDNKNKNHLLTVIAFALAFNYSDNPAPLCFILFYFLTYFRWIEQLFLFSRLLLANNVELYPHMRAKTKPKKLVFIQSARSSAVSRFSHVNFVSHHVEPQMNLIALWIKNRMMSQKIWTVKMARLSRVDVSDKTVCRVSSRRFCPLFPQSISSIFLTLVCIIFNSN